MNYQIIKRFVPKRFRQVFKQLLLDFIAYREFSTTGYKDYKRAKQKKRERIKTDDLISIQLSDNKALHLRSRYTDIDIFEQIFLIKDCEIPIEINPKIIIDAGAHIGCSAMYYALKYPKATIYAIELSPLNFGILKKNAKEVKNIIPINAGIWNAPIDLSIDNPDDDGWSFKVNRTKNRISQETVKSIQIMEIIKMTGEERVDLIKIDIEGAEKEIFSVGSNEWLQYVDHMIIELHDRFVPGCTENFNEAMTKYNFNSFDTTFNLIRTNIRQKSA